MGRTLLCGQWRHELGRITLTVGGGGDPAELGESFGRRTGGQHLRQSRRLRSVRGVTGDACRYFDLCELANMLADVPRAASSLQSAEVFDARYRRQYLTTGTVATAIRAKITERPRDFPSDNTQ